MLIATLREAVRPVNYGNFTPRRRDASSGGSIGATVRVGGVPTDTRGSSSRSATPRTPRSDRAGPLPITPTTGAKLAPGAVPSEVTIHHQVFPNRNSYHGSWLDGRMHGEGLYSWSDGSEYAGEFKDGFVWGTGEKRWPNGRKYRGQWVQDLQWGDGEMTWPSGETFAGQFCKGLAHGRGTRLWPSGDVYAGEFRSGEQEGQGRFNSSEGWTYEGSWQNGVISGRGTAWWPGGVTYVGEWRQGVREGHGVLTWPDGSEYQGQFRNNCIEGRGRKTTPDGSWFEGTFQEGELEGHGACGWPDGTEFEGLWHNSEVVGPGLHKQPDGTCVVGVFDRDGRGASGEGAKQWPGGCSYTGQLQHNSVYRYGVLKWPDGRCYVGQFEDQAMHGDGLLTWSTAQGLCRYKGQFRNNQFHGQGVLDWASRARYTGSFEHGQYHGEGTFEWPDGGSVYRGQWDAGTMCGKGTLSTDGKIEGGSSEAYVYVGDFLAGEMEGRGHVTFISARSEKHDEYKGEFRASSFHGLGIFGGANGVGFQGLFDRNLCNGPGSKQYSDGKVYHGQLKDDLEDGLGMLQMGAHRLVGTWSAGRLVAQLPEGFQGLASPDGEEVTLEKVFLPLRQPGPTPDEVSEEPASAEEVEGEAIELYESGDYFVGKKQAGQRNGPGMYVYADLTAHKATWKDGVLMPGNVSHPLPAADRTPLALKINKLNKESKVAEEELRPKP